MPQWLKKQQWNHQDIIGVEIIHRGDQGKHQQKPFLSRYSLVHHHHPLEHFGHKRSYLLLSQV
jgi:hypothetical protein